MKKIQKSKIEKIMAALVPTDTIQLINPTKKQNHKQITNSHSSTYYLTMMLDK